jgi:hypothetical protein
MDLIQLHEQIQNPTNYVVDIGASYAVTTDPTYKFITDKKYNGLCIEGSADKISTLERMTHFEICNKFITPHNILDIFQSYNVPVDLDVLKIDIDGFDLEIIRTVLSVYKPKIIIAEINEKIPPPILFEVKYKEDYSWDESHIYGFSIQSGKQLMDSVGYKILEIFELNNIVCVNSELCDILGKDKTNEVYELYRTQYIENSSRYSVLPWNSNVNHWLDIKDAELLKQEIVDYFCNVNCRSKFEKKTKVLDEDFSIGISDYPTLSRDSAFAELSPLGLRSEIAQIDATIHCPGQTENMDVEIDATIHCPGQTENMDVEIDAIIPNQTENMDVEIIEI